MDMIEIRTDLIDEDVDQPRYQFDEDALQELMKSIEELGLLSPIKVRAIDGGRYKIVYGNRRYKACKTLGLRTIPCIVSTVTDELDIYLEQIAENLTREGFSPIEEAEAFHKLMNDAKFNMSTKFLASKLGKPEAYIKNKCELLKFGNAVKKLVVGGTQIRKDKLTEDQLMPLKDLPIEHRDPLALIAARDELPVSDVKKIARLFKDNNISAGTKDKLLFKTGPALIETWSVYQQNKAEREKPVQPKTSAKAKAAGAETAEESALTADATATQNANAATAQAFAPEAMAAVEPNAAAYVTVNQYDSGNGAAQPGSVVPIEDSLQRLLAAVSTHSPFTAEIIHSYETMSPSEQERIAKNVDVLIDNLENQLAKWRKVRDLMKK